MFKSLQYKVENFINLKRFFITQKSKILKFSTSSTELLPWLDLDAIKHVSDYIELAYNTDLEKLDTFEKLNSDLKYLLKIAWLIKDISTNGQQNPIQLIQSGDKYLSHPGTARLLVLTYILPSDKIDAFYIWHKEFDANPFFLHNATEVKSAKEFVKLFKHNKRLKFRSATISNETITNPYFSQAQAGMLKTDKYFKVRTLSMVDDSHWNNSIINKINLKDVIQFTDSVTCTVSGIRFKKINELWIRQ